MALSGDGGASSGEVPLFCGATDVRQHASCALTMPPSRRAGEPASAASPRAVPHLQAAVVHPPSKVESGARFNADTQLRMDIAVEIRGL